MLGYRRTPPPNLPRRTVGGPCHRSLEGGLGGWKGGFNDTPPPCANLFHSALIDCQTVMDTDSWTSADCSVHPPHILGASEAPAWSWSRRACRGLSYGYHPCACLLLQFSQMFGGVGSHRIGHATRVHAHVHAYMTTTAVREADVWCMKESTMYCLQVSDRLLWGSHAQGGC